MQIVTCKTMINHVMRDTRTPHEELFTHTPIDTFSLGGSLPILGGPGVTRIYWLAPEGRDWEGWYVAGAGGKSYPLSDLADEETLYAVAPQNTYKLVVYLHDDMLPGEIYNAIRGVLELGETQRGREVWLVEDYQNGLDYHYRIYKLELTSLPVEGPLYSYIQFTPLDDEDITQDAEGRPVKLSVALSFWRTKPEKI